MSDRSSGSVRSNVRSSVPGASERVEDARAALLRELEIAVPDRSLWTTGAQRAGGSLGDLAVAAAQTMARALARQSETSVRAEYARIQQFNVELQSQAADLQRRNQELAVPASLTERRIAEIKAATSIEAGRAAALESESAALRTLVEQSDVELAAEERRLAEANANVAAAEAKRDELKLRVDANDIKLREYKNLERKRTEAAGATSAEVNGLIGKLQEYHARLLEIIRETTNLPDIDAILNRTDIADTELQKIADVPLGELRQLDNAWTDELNAYKDAVREIKVASDVFDADYKDARVRLEEAMARRRDAIRANDAESSAAIEKLISAIPTPPPPVAA